MFKSNTNPMFRSKFSEDIFNHKYAHEGAETWSLLAWLVVDDVVGDYMSIGDKKTLARYIEQLKFIPGGRYLYYAGRTNKFFNNCYLLKAEEDTREDWADLSWKAESCLMTGGGIGVDYSVYRGENELIKRTGGKASGPIPKMMMVNEIGRHVMQGGSRRSALYASLKCTHADIEKFLVAKDWKSIPVGNTGMSVWDLKQQDFNFHAPLDMTNISVNYNTQWLENYRKTGDYGSVFRKNVEQALKTAEPGFSFNFFDKENETLRNAPVSGDTEVLTSDGYRRVFDVVDEEIEVWTGKQWAKTIFRKTKECVDTITITYSGGRSITCDPEHEFFVEIYTGKGKRRKLVGVNKVRADSLSVGDILHVSLPTPAAEEFDKSSYTLGYVYGDGSFRKSGTGGGEITLCTDASKSCLEFFDDSMFSSVTNIDSRGYTRCYIKSAVMERGYKEIFPEKCSQSFIAGLFDADGSYDEALGRVRLSSKHRSFLVGTQRYLESIGILSSITTGGVSTYGKNVGYLLVVNSAYVTDFSRLIPTKRLNVKPHDAYRDSILKVKSIEPAKIQDVYCCDVKVDEHSFQANGVIISNCTEVTSEDDSDVCNLASLNFGRIESIEELKDIITLGTKFLICGTLKAQLPYEKIYKVREKSRRLGLGIMGVHEWLIKRGSKYEVTPELHQWLHVYKDVSTTVSAEFADSLSISRPVANRAIAPTGTIGILAGTSTGIEPIFAVAYKRRYLKGKTRWVHQYVVDSAAQELISVYGVDPNKVESALDLAKDYERRIKFQADIQDYVDMSISSTINLPAWGTELNNEDRVDDFAATLAKYAHRLRGFTCYPDGARGGQPLTSVHYKEAVSKLGTEFEEHVETHDICDISGSGGSCGV